MKKSSPHVSIIICTYNDEKTIGAVLTGVVDLTYPNKEIIVINDCSTDKTADIVRQFPGVILVNNPVNLGLGASMNRGGKLAKGSVVIFLQSDCVVRDPHWIGKMLEPFQDEEVGVVVSQRVIKERAKLSLGARLFDSVSPQSLVNKTGKPVEIGYFRGKADAYRREIIEELGYWDNETFFTAGEDTDLSIKLRKAGYKIILSDTAQIEYLFSSRQDSVLAGLRKAFLYGTVAAALYKRHRYDGLQTRLYLLCLTSFVLIPLWLLSAKLGAAIYSILFLLSFTTPVRSLSLDRQFPFGVLLAAVLALLLGLNLTGHIQLGLSSIPLSVALGCGAYCLYMGLKSSLRSVTQGDSYLLLPVRFFYALAWRFLSGIGYLRGWLTNLSYCKDLAMAALPNKQR